MRKSIILISLLLTIVITTPATATICDEASMMTAKIDQKEATCRIALITAQKRINSGGKVDLDEWIKYEDALEALVDSQRDQLSMKEINSHCEKMAIEQIEKEEGAK